jgi:hypothetical protein
MNVSINVFWAVKPRGVFRRRSDAGIMECSGHTNKAGQMMEQLFHLVEHFAERATFARKSAGGDQAWRSNGKTKGREMDFGSDMFFILP